MALKLAPGPAGFALSGLLLSLACAAPRILHEGDRLDQTSFYGKDLTGAVFRICRMDGIRFENATGSAPSFQGSSGTGANFRGASFTDADFSGAFFLNSDFEG